jgi:hypothetical protein
MQMLLSPCRQRCTNLRHGDMCLKETLLFSHLIAVSLVLVRSSCAAACILVSMQVYGQHLPFLFSKSTLKILPYAFLELEVSAFTTYNLIYS